MNTIPMANITAPDATSRVRSAEPKDGHPLTDSSMPSSPSPQTRLLETSSSTRSSSDDSNSGDPRPSLTPSSLSRNQSSELLSASSKGFVSSPLNPSPSSSPPLFGPKRPHARPNFPRVASEDVRALSMRSSRASSMVLYRLADVPGELGLPPPIRGPHDRSSVVSSSGDSIISLSSDSKYPSNYSTMSERGIIAYAYDPTPDDVDFDDDEFHNPKLDQRPDRISTRGIINISALVLVMIGILALFVVYPAYTITRGNSGPEDNTIDSCINDIGQIDESLEGCEPFRVQSRAIENNGDENEVTKRDQIPISGLLGTHEVEEELLTNGDSSFFDFVGIFVAPFQETILELPICADDDELLVQVRFRRTGRDQEISYWNHGDWASLTEANREQLSHQPAHRPRRGSWKYSVLEMHLPSVSEDEVEMDSIFVSQRTSPAHTQSCEGSRQRRQILDISDALLS